MTFKMSQTAVLGQIDSSIFEVGVNNVDYYKRCYGKIGIFSERLILKNKDFFVTLI